MNLYDKSPDSKGYVLNKDIVYYSKRYNKTKTVKKGTWSDGATGFVDLGANKFWSKLFAWIRNRVHHLKGNLKSGWFFVHDEFCKDPYWDDGTSVSNLVASTIAMDLLIEAKYYFLSIPVWLATFLFGGEKIKKKNGWFRVKNVLKACPFCKATPELKDLGVGTGGKIVTCICGAMMTAYARETFSEPDIHKEIGERVVNQWNTRKNSLRHKKNG